MINSIDRGSYDVHKFTKLYGCGTCENACPVEKAAVKVL